ncbi:hypothetical protein AZL_000570 [Azospirillum sp. B510]|uniref:replication protein C, IncQ-type n=1 Tax=Azospirillum sp. (strain B510) TaxID=137722 RepID=UPI0001C4B9E0|nr:replication protein C, IncQ-type [Azospirillum sp. B510]BAI70695.1 hypothetical protein AZL_000570 [Azospirillum sp. B510]
MPDTRLTLTEYALVDTGLMGLPLFRPLPRRGRTAARNRHLDLTTTHGGAVLRVGGPVLGADDLSVLLAVCALAGMDGKRLDAAHSEAHRIAIVDGLETEGGVVDDEHVRLRTTVYAVVREAGLAHGGDAYRRVAESLWRLRGIHYAELGREGGNARRMKSGARQNLIGFDADEVGGELRVVLNARFATAVLGGAQHSRINLLEHRQLTEAGRLLHLTLSVQVRPGGYWPVALDGLADRLYGEPPTSDRQRRDRRVILRAALAEVAGLPGWSADENLRSIVTVRRAPRPRRR